MAKNEWGAYSVNPNLHPHQFAAGVLRVANLARTASKETIESGREWYPIVHEAVGKGARDLGISHLHGSGIVAAVSPNMDFESRNIHALSEIGNLTPKHWKMIERSAAQPRSPGRGGAPKRDPEVRGMLREVAPSIAAAPDVSLLKARRILHGEHPGEVLSRYTAPKTHSFTMNIHHPSANEFVTIDGRAADIVSNRRIPWDVNRGLGTGYYKRASQGLTSYQHHENVYREAAKGLSRSRQFKGISAVELQAVTWVRGKEIEASQQTGGKRTPRAGQPYLHEDEAIPGGRPPRVRR